MARELTINDLTDHVFDSGTSIYLNGYKVLEGISTPLAVNLENFLLKTDEERLKNEFTEHANEVIAENIVGSSSLRETVESIVAQEVSESVPSEETPGTVRVFSSYNGSSTGASGYMRDVYDTTYINDVIFKTKSDISSTIATVEGNLTRNLNNISEVVYNNSSIAANLETRTLNLINDFSSLGKEVDAIAESMEELGIAVERVNNFESRINSLESRTIDDDATIVDIKDGIAELERIAATKDEVNSLTSDMARISDVDAVEAQIQPLSERIDAQEEKVQDFEANLNNTEILVDQLEGNILNLATKNEVELQVQTLRNSVSSGLSTKVESEDFERNRGVVETKLASLDLAIRDNILGISSLNTDVSRLNQNIADVSSEIQEAVSPVANQVSSIEKDIANISASVARKASSTEVSNIQTDIEVKFASVEDAISDKGNELTALSVDLANLENSIASVARSVADLETRHNSEIVSIEGEIQTVLGTIEGLEAEMVARGSQTLEASEAYTDTKIEGVLSDTKTELAKITNTVNNFEGKVSELTQKISDVECEFNGYRTATLALQEKVDVLESFVLKLRQDYESITQLFEHGHPLFADYVTESPKDVSLAPVSLAKSIYLKVPSDAGTMYYHINCDFDDNILLEKQVDDEG